MLKDEIPNVFGCFTAGWKECPVWSDAPSSDGSQHGAAPLPPHLTSNVMSTISWKFSKKIQSNFSKIQINFKETKLFFKKYGLFF